MEIVKLSEDNFRDIILKAASLLKKGGVLMLPTDTIYGIAASAESGEAVRRIFEIKKRPEDKMIPIFVGSIEMAERLIPIPNAHARKILETFWPGKLTAVLDRERPGLRIPNHKFVLSLLQKFRAPIACTSANISSREGHTKILEVIKEFESKSPKPGLIIDAGDLPKSLPSTVADFTVYPPKILRQGAVSQAELEKAPKVVY